MPNKKEERCILTNAEFRAGEKDGRKYIEGYAAVFDVAADRGWYTEYVRKNAFNKTIKESDIRGLFNHDENYILGRNTAKTLELSTDDHGLFFRDYYNSDAEWIRGQVVDPIVRGELSQCSFSFKVVGENGQKWFTEKYKNSNGIEIDRDARELLELRLYDLGPVTFPAYETTIVSARSLFEENGIDIDMLSQALLRTSKGQILSPEHREMIKKSVEIFSRYSLEEPPPGHSSESAKPINVTLLRKKLELLEKSIL
jgi:uncharacterized protein